jgi:hypothetical protein
VAPGEFLERAETLGDPVPVPRVDGRLILTQRPLQVVQDAQVVQRMDVAGDAERHGAHDGAIGRLARQQRRVRANLLEVLDDGQRLAEDAPRVLDRGHQALWVDLEVALEPVLAPAPQQVLGNLLAGDTLVVQRDAGPGTRRSCENR